jgi:hypothetical protein
MVRSATDPWDNDAAEYWFRDLFERSHLARRVAETLRLDPVEYPEEVRAAAAIVIFLGRSRIWPEESLVANLELAAARLERIGRDRLLGDDPSLYAEVEREIRVLHGRLQQVTCAVGER